MNWFDYFRKVNLFSRILKYLICENIVIFYWFVDFSFCSGSLI